MKKKVDYLFFLVIVIGFLFIYILTKKNLFLYISFGVGAFVLAFPNWAHYIEWFWGKLTLVLSYITNTVILSILFYLFLTPISFLSKLSKRNKLNLLPPATNSLFTIRNYKYSKKDLENLW